MNLRALKIPTFLIGLALLAGPAFSQNDSAPPAAEPAPVTEPAADKPASDKPAADKPASDKPASDKPASDKPASDKPASDKPASDKPASDKPASDKPAADKPVPTGKPSKDEEPGVKPAEPTGAAEAEDDEFGFEEIEKLTHVMEIIRQNYVDEQKVDYEDLINSALQGMLSNLDPHCQFMYPEVFEQMKRDTDGSYEGVGITVAVRSDVLTVVAVREDGPAARSGILPGDQIVMINEFLTERIGLSEAMSLMKGQPGQPLKLTVRRPANNELLEVDLVREVIQESTVQDVMMLPSRYAGDRKIGYARLLQFSEPTARDLAEGLDRLEKDGMEAFILDLRNNPGGLLNSAIDVCGEFVPANTLVLTTEGREGIVNARVYRTPTRKRTERDYPMAILVNHASASGAEVVAGALQDLKRAVIVGETSFGKGSVQSVIPVPGGNAIRVTTAKYYTPSHRTIHENGVEPNIVATLTVDEERNLLEWFRRDTLEPTRKRKIEQWEDRQLSRAADALKGIMVYQNVAANWKQKEPEAAAEAPEPAAPAGAAPLAETPVDAPEDPKMEKKGTEPGSKAETAPEKKDPQPKPAPADSPAAPGNKPPVKEKAPEPAPAPDAPKSPAAEEDQGGN